VANELQLDRRTILTFAFGATAACANSNAACAATQPTSPTSRAEPVLTEMATEERVPEPPLWEQWAQQRAQLPQGERLQKVLAQRGYGSRRVCEDLIAAGRVRVNGQPVRLGWRVEVDRDHVEVDGHVVSVRPGLVHYLLNKPAGGVTTAKDTHGRPTVVDLVPPEPRVFPVGRLDADTEGLLLLTNDGDLAHQLTHPSFGVEKEYLAQVARPLGTGALRRLREGVELDDGLTAPARASQPEPGLVRVTIHEGRNRQVRRMCDAVGHPVQRLVRLRMGDRQPLVAAGSVAQEAQHGPDEGSRISQCSTKIGAGRIHQGGAEVSSVLWACRQRVDKGLGLIAPFVYVGHYSPGPIEWPYPGPLSGVPEGELPYPRPT
jgi:23S rRNA pseudouridine2605 synthase